MCRFCNFHFWTSGIDEFKSTIATSTLPNVKEKTITPDICVHSVKSIGSNVKGGVMAFDEPYFDEDAERTYWVFGALFIAGPGFRWPAS